jgi:hypothetical protein
MSVETIIEHPDRVIRPRAATRSTIWIQYAGSFN